jgi:hypothetical protein
MSPEAELAVEVDAPEAVGLRDVRSPDDRNARAGDQLPVLGELDGHDRLEVHGGSEPPVSSVYVPFTEAEIELGEERPDVGDRVRQLLSHLGQVLVLFLGGSGEGDQHRDKDPHRKKSRAAAHSLGPP